MENFDYSFDKSQRTLREALGITQERSMEMMEEMIAFPVGSDPDTPVTTGDIIEKTINVAKTNNELIFMMYKATLLYREFEKTDCSFVEIL